MIESYVITCFYSCVRHIKFKICADKLIIVFYVSVFSYYGKAIINTSHINSILASYLCARAQVWGTENRQNSWVRQARSPDMGVMFTPQIQLVPLQLASAPT